MPTRNEGGRIPRVTRAVVRSPTVQLTTWQAQGTMFLQKSNSANKILLSEESSMKTWAVPQANGSRLPRLTGNLPMRCCLETGYLTNEPGDHCSVADTQGLRFLFSDRKWIYIKTYISTSKITVLLQTKNHCTYG